MLNLLFYKNSAGVHIGDLYKDEQRLLATTHPATIAAAVFALDEYSLTVKTDKGVHTMHFPCEDEDMMPLTLLCVDAEMVQFMTGLATFSNTNYSAPPGSDKHAEVHFRTAVHHLPDELVKNAPKGPVPKTFKAALRERNRFIYYPWE
ncbi:hypothetical protein QZM42_05375 [Burkholderia vietnamiensis]|uniref:hypothetical protein n=1 Tax=Burkholderia vietnamiensis TaxID=60552 RepID=UPI00264DD4A8|nr:hypothetical protein [Burkholderia vietnamiensis]MDN7407975.1 hypothetical protein [Burkholderia vietnamiensis]